MPLVSYLLICWADYSNLRPNSTESICWKKSWATKCKTYCTFLYSLRHTVLYNKFEKRSKRSLGSMKFSSNFDSPLVLLQSFKIRPKLILCFRFSSVSSFYWTVRNISAVFSLLLPFHWKILFASAAVTLLEFSWLFS